MLQIWYTDWVYTWSGLWSLCISRCGCILAEN